MNLPQSNTTLKAPRSLFFAGVFGLLALPNSAHAAVTMTYYESGADVIVVSTGTLNLTELTFVGSGFSLPAQVNPDTGMSVSGSATPTLIDVYVGASGPSGFGPGGQLVNATSGVGDTVGVYATTGSIYVPDVFVSGGTIGSISTYVGQSIASLGLTPGTYVYNWGITKDADSLTVVIVPEPSASVLLGLGVTALLFRRRRLA